MPAPSSAPPSRLLLLLKLLLLLCVLGMLWLGISPLYQAAQRLLGSPPPATATKVQLLLLPSEPQDTFQVRPLQRSLQLQAGAFVSVEYDITNHSPGFVALQALPRYQPAGAAAYIQKLNCFCQAEQRFQPGQTRRFQVVFVLAKQLPASLRQLELAYQVQVRPL